jgi:predicted nucleotidyltransferase
MLFPDTNQIMSNSSSIEKKILHFFEKTPHVVSVSLFGSYARGVANSESDVDVAVLFENAHVPEVLTLIEQREDLGALLQKEVDLICLNTASPIIGMQVYNNGKNLLVKDTRSYAQYQMFLFTSYAELKELRAPMEKGILKRKLHD